MCPELQPWLTLALSLRSRRLPPGKGYLPCPLTWQHLSLSIHNLLGSQINLLNRHILTFLPTPRERSLLLWLLKPVVLSGCDSEKREGKELDISRETGVQKCWLRWHREMFQLQLCCRAEQVSWGEGSRQHRSLYCCSVGLSRVPSTEWEWRKLEEERAWHGILDQTH